MATDNGTTIDYVRRRDEAAKVLGISTRTLARMEKLGKAPQRTQITERCFGYRDSVLKDFLNSRTA